MTEIDNNPEKKESFPILELCVSEEAREILDRFCEARPDIAERVKHEAETQAKIMIDFSLEHVDDADWAGAYDAVFLRPMMDGSELERELFNKYNPEHRFLTLAVLSDMEKVDNALDSLRTENKELSEIINSSLDHQNDGTTFGFDDRFDYADARVIDRKFQGICPQAVIGNASAILYRLNRTEDYSKEQALVDIVDAQSVLSPTFQLGKDAFSMALDDSSEIARRLRAGQLDSLEDARIMLEKTFGDDEKAIENALNTFFSDVVAVHTDKNGDAKGGLSMRSVVGHFSGEHSVRFYTMTGFIDDVEVKVRARGKGLVSLADKIVTPEYDEDFDINDPTTWPQDLLAGTVVIGKKEEDERDKVDMDAEERNVVGVAKVLKYLVTHIGLESMPELRFQASGSRDHAVHIRGDKLYVDRMTLETGFDDTNADIVTNNDHSFQVAKVTCGVSLSQRNTPVNTEVQVMTRRSRKNSRDGDSAHWLLKKGKAIIRRLPLEVQRTLDKHYDPLTPQERLAGSARMKSIKTWLKSTIASSYSSIMGVNDFCDKRGIKAA